MNAEAMTTVILTAATKWEESPLVRRLGKSATIVKTGIGPENTARALSKTVDPQRFGLVISTGFAGALQPGMRSGDIIADLQGLELSMIESARETAAALGLRIHFGKIIHSNVVATEKAELGRRFRAGAVDMESAAVRRWAAERGISACAIRVVLDEVSDRLPPLPQGEDFPSLAAYAFANWRQLPLLASTGLKQRRAASALCSFLEAFLEKL